MDDIEATAQLVAKRRHVRQQEQATHQARAELAEYLKWLKGQPGWTGDRLAGVLGVSRMQAYRLMAHCNGGVDSVDGNV